MRVGAHPSYPDRDGFGRRPMEIDRERAAARRCAEQLRALDARLPRRGHRPWRRSRPHGALYEEVAKGGAVYETFRDAVRDSCR